MNGIFPGLERLADEMKATREKVEEWESKTNEKEDNND